jgi:hypothetical protein
VPTSFILIYTVKLDEFGAFDANISRIFSHRVDRYLNANDLAKSGAS